MPYKVQEHVPTLEEQHSYSRYYPSWLQVLQHLFSKALAGLLVDFPLGSRSFLSIYRHKMEKPSKYNDQLQYTQNVYRKWKKESITCK
mmetsp:Transcript_23633/g.57959  ORF Transcript_23633/g.57959 Transcript_23633/m.57959 type:complete len:88 (+) Transcript_23633:1909-2172(+)